MSAFHLRRLPAATTYLDRAADIDPGNRSVRLYLAAALLLDSKSGQAAGIYLGLLESEPRDARAAAALAFIRTGEDAGAFSGFGGGMRLAKLLPRDRGGRILRRMIAATVFAVVVAAAAAIVFMR